MNDNINFTRGLARFRALTSEVRRRLFMKAALDHFFRADEAFLAGAYAAADEQFGSFDAFLANGLGIDEAKREELRRLCLD